MRNRNIWYTPDERLSIVQEVAALPTVREQRARLKDLGTSWGSFVRWRKLYQAHGAAGLTTKARSTITVQLEALCLEVRGLRADVQALTQKIG